MVRNESVLPAIGYDSSIENKGSRKLSTPLIGCASNDGGWLLVPRIFEKIYTYNKEVEKRSGNYGQISKHIGGCGVHT